MASFRIDCHAQPHCQVGALRSLRHRHSSPRNHCETNHCHGQFTLTIKLGSNKIHEQCCTISAALEHRSRCCCCSLLPSAWRVVVLVFHLVDRQRRCASLEYKRQAGAPERMWYALAQTPKCTGSQDEPSKQRSQAKKPNEKPSLPQQTANRVRMVALKEKKKKANEALAWCPEIVEIKETRANVVSIQGDDSPGAAKMSRGHGMFGDRSSWDRIAVFIENSQDSAHLLAAVAGQQPDEARELLV